MKVLFLCTGNSCRSILGEFTFNHLAPSGWRAMSAGSRPTGYVHPRSLALLESEGISTDSASSKSWEDLPEVPDIVITVCGSAAGEECPAYIGNVLRTHWGVEDPAHVTGTDAQINAAFRKAYTILRARIEAFLALPLDRLVSDRGAIRTALDEIGQLMPTDEAGVFTQIDPRDGDLVEALAAAGLPTTDLGTAQQTFWRHSAGGEVRGFVGIEAYGKAGLLRSLVVPQTQRGKGHGVRLIDFAVAQADRAGLTELWLLTDTAAPFFARTGWTPRLRADAPDDIQSSAEFAGLCPSSASCFSLSVPAYL
ncbi:arsenic resistance N-acetyltransferase ArsN2 [Asticcacaulis sp. BYS171W]|uniref:Arsenic resistance N-acetyltransferase ArsN2 n=1 Tax=Asticcacaulis aquaticus TaxID=2984212 RepID=A0ABT5HWN3_9CAUL|nr:arsenic resistance N-acetyltransferase ArsN2 [Asticcacaulis aquaticus]MDC7684492.1 arsenic resistance N-acetyltransferase ArsN2 [Asticcacaulis aquaticus]